jgi:hypothetical protein
MAKLCVVLFLRRGAEEDEHDEGDGGDSDTEAAGVDDQYEAMLEVVDDGIAHLGIQEDDDNLGANNNDNALILHLGERNTPAELLPVPGTPLDWQPPLSNTTKGEPDFSTLGNPGEWTPFTFRPDFDKTNPKQYKKLSLPTRATPVPASG